MIPTASLPVLIAVGLVLNAAAALFVLWRGSLDPGGAAVGVVIGTVIFACGPFFWLILMVFFISSTVLTSVGRHRKAALAQIHEKGGRRDMFQVLANGGVGALCAVLFKVTGNPAWAVGLAVSFAASNADTWASELGVLSRKPPRSLLTFRPVTRGVSGGVSVLGSAMALAGGLLIGFVFAVENLSLQIVPTGFLQVTCFVALGGFVGSMLDSFLGATVQAQYESARGKEPTELKRGDDGRPNRLVRGLAFVNNDLVNLASCFLSTLLWVLFSLIRH